MDKPAKDAIHDLVLSLRKTLEGEVEREMGRYGIYADRAWIDASTLPRLSAKERDEGRPRIEAAIQREQGAGLGQAEAVWAFIRETVYTHMNLPEWAKAPTAMANRPTTRTWTTA